MQLGWIRVPNSDHYDPANFRKAPGCFDFQCQPVFQSSLLSRAEGGQDCFFWRNVGWCHLWMIIHLQCQMVWDCYQVSNHTWRRKQVTTEQLSFLKIQVHIWRVLICQRRAFSSEPNRAWKTEATILSCGQTSPWAQGRHQVRSPQGQPASPPVTEAASHLYANGTLWPYNAWHLNCIALAFPVRSTYKADDLAPTVLAAVTSSGALLI